jgi:hypothetical protein
LVFCVFPAKNRRKKTRRNACGGNPLAALQSPVFCFLKKGRRFAEKRRPE